jgi:phosphoribosylglycinamide formyltransferase 1
MRALIEACQQGHVPATVTAVVAPVEGTAASEIAQTLGVPVLVVEAGDDYPNRLLEALSECDWVCLAGFMRLLPVEVLRAFPGRVLNVHPALLPKFGGKGMYGMHVHRAVLEAGEQESGCTVHVVTEAYDEGPIVLQARCEVLPEDTPETLAARVLALEHEAYPRALAEAIRASRH